MKNGKEDEECRRKNSCLSINFELGAIGELLTAVGVWQ
jgi:hypothetical protein